jgi:hypothetical protein
MMASILGCVLLFWMISHRGLFDGDTSTKLFKFQPEASLHTLASTFTHLTLIQAICLTCVGALSLIVIVSNIRILRDDIEEKLFVNKTYI